MENFEKIGVFTSKTKEEIKQMNLEEIKVHLKNIDSEFQKISENPKLDENFAQARQTIDQELHRILDQFPELQEWYENEL